MRRGGGGGGGGRIPRTPSTDLPFSSRRDSDATSLCSSMGGARSSIAATSHHHAPTDRASQAAALRAVNAYLAPAVSLRPPLPSARDILAAFRRLLDRLALPPTPAAVAAFEDDLLNLLRGLGCPHKLTRSALKAPGTPHSWPPLLAVLHWLTLLARARDDLRANGGGGRGGEAERNDLTVYVTQSYALFISGDDDAVEALDEEYVTKAREHAEAAAEAVRALEKEAEEVAARRKRHAAVPSRTQALQATKDDFTADVHKFEKVMANFGVKVHDVEETVADLERELENKRVARKRMEAENEEMAAKVAAQVVNVRDVDRMRREMQAVEQDIAKFENGKAALEEKSWELQAALARKHDEVDGLAEQCNQELRKLKPGVDFQYVLNAEGSSPSEILGTSYKTILKPALNVLADETKRQHVKNLEELNDIEHQLDEKAKILEEKNSHISSQQAKSDEMVNRVNSLDLEIENHVSRCKADARKMKEEFQKKEQRLSTVERESDEFLKNAEQMLHDTLKQGEKETQMCADELLQLIQSVSEFKEFREASISAMKKDLYECADDIAKMASSHP